MRRRIQQGDMMEINTRFLGDGEPIMGSGAWLAAEDEAEDGHVLIERTDGSERQRYPAYLLVVTDTVEERVANTLMKREEGEAR